MVAAPPPTYPPLDFFLGGEKGVQAMVSWQRIRAVQCCDCHTVDADVTRSEDELNLMPGNAAGTATPVGIPVCNQGMKDLRLRKTALCNAQRKQCLKRNQYLSGKGCSTPTDSPTPCPGDTGVQLFTVQTLTVP